MAIVLYKSGNMAKVNGISCQVQVCNEFSYLHLLEEGWFYTPKEVLEAEVKEKEEIVEEVIVEEEAPETDLGEATETEPPELALTDEEIRTAAKEAGIGHWHNKSIERLVNELKEPEDAE